VARAVLLAGLQFGDEGKGSVTDFLCSRGYNLVVRYNGGPQAAHNVVFWRNGQRVHHCFSQFGSGSFHGAKTILSRHMAIDPPALLEEGRVLESKGVPAFDLLRVDEACTVITPYHRIANRMREMTRSVRHGSCGVGVGEAVLDREKGAPGIQVGENAGHLRRKLEEIREYKIESLKGLRDFSQETESLFQDLLEKRVTEVFASYFQQIISRVRVSGEAELREAVKNHSTVFEGAQGVLLDRDSGFFPYVTPSKTTLALAEEWIAGLDLEVHRVGVMRSYTVRHGAGPMPGETKEEALARVLRDEHNIDSPWQGSLRTGWLDLVLLRYALSVCKVDSIAVTGLDRMAEWRFCEKYDLGGEDFYSLGPGGRGGEFTRRLMNASGYFSEPVDAGALLQKIESVCGVPVLIESTGPAAPDKKVHPDFPIPENNSG